MLREETSEQLPFRMTTSAEVDTPTDARHRAHDFLVEQGVAPELLEPAELVLSELVSNAVAQDGFDIELAVRTDGDAVHLAVTYESPGEPPPHPEGSHEGGGWALRVIDELATRWDIHPRSDGKPGNTLWAEILLA